MLTFNKLGKSGRLGNQMFQYAALRGIAANRGFDWAVPPPGTSGIDEFGTENNYCMFETFKLPYATEEHHGLSDTRRWAVWKEFHFNRDLFDGCPDNVNLDGYFQTEKYFKNIEDEIRKDFEFQDDIYGPCKEMMDSLGGDRMIFLHIRRGDPKLPWAYVNLQNAHPVQTWEYYEQALAQFPDDIPVLVFSDVIEWCQEQEFFKPDRFIMSETTDEFADGQRVPWTDLCLMSLCTDAIIANSSYSWWGAWLMANKDKKVIAPKKWFGSQFDHYDMSDLIPEGWIEL
jgi:hypothetical protein|tara:strand:- start:1805 stop:2662 length:858 start_codon:yes stop_codon:yes gene_type:complete